MGRSDERAAKNEAAFRDANERIERRRVELGVEERTPYICECSREDCTAIVRLFSEEYREVRAAPERFLQLAGHADASERVVAERDGYVVVEKLGAGARIAREEA